MADQDLKLARLLSEGDERALTELARRFQGPARNALQALPDDEREDALRAALVLAWNNRDQRGQAALAPWFFKLLAQASGSRDLAERLPQDPEGWSVFEELIQGDDLPDDDAARRLIAAVLKDPALIRSPPAPNLEVRTPSERPEPQRSPTSPTRGLLILILIIGFADLALTILDPRTAAPKTPPPDRLVGTDLRATCDADSERVSITLWLDDQQSQPRYQRAGPLVADSITIKRSELGAERHRLRYRIAHRRPQPGPEKAGAMPWRVVIVVEQQLPSAREAEDFESWLPIHKIELNAAIAAPVRTEQRGGEAIDVYEGDLLLAGD